MSGQRWREFFPLPTPRREQEVVLDRLVELVDSGERMLILEAGTGVGKSAIAVCMANYISSLGDRGDYEPGAYVLTSQKILQDQYLRDFGQAADIRSSANFQCTGGPGENCGQTMRYMMYGARKDPTHPHPNSCPGCPYREAKQRFISARLGVTNYSYFMSETVYAGELGPRELLVLDEAHNIESEMRRWSTVEIDEELAARVGVQYPYSAGRVATVDWAVNEYRPALTRYIYGLTCRLEELEKKGIRRGLSLLIDQLDQLDRHVCGFNRVFSEDSDYEMLIDWQEQQSGRRSLMVQPLDAGRIATDLLYPRGRRVLLMSATLLSDGIFRRAAGVSGGSFVSCPTPFPARNFGIVYRPVGRMSRAHIQRTLPNVVAAVRRVLRDHPEEKGIIHCSSYEVTRAIATIGDRRLIIQGSAKDREEMLRKHRSSREPTVLVSPSMMEGLDLEGDLGRFQVICKIPFPNMGDPVVEAKRRTGDEWYSWCTARTLIQAIGRCVRSVTDTTRTYILDESFGRFFEDWAGLFPPYFAEMDIDV